MSYVGYTEEQLRQKEEELERREQQLEFKERKLNELKQTLPQEKPLNWPVCRPMIHHDIRGEIPEDGRNLVKRLYFAWMLCCGVYLFNTIALFIALVVTGDAGTSFGISLIFVFLGIPVSFVFWYRPLYVGVKEDRSISYMFFFFNFSCHIGFSIVMAVGINGSGGGGFITAVSFLKERTFVGIILLVSGSLWSLLALYDFWQIKNVIMYYRGKGHTAQSARNDAIREAVTSETGRAVAIEAGKSALQA